MDESSNANDSHPLTEHEQLQAWWESLSDDHRAAALDVDVDDIPGWMIASLAAARVRLAEDQDSASAENFQYRIPVALREFIQRKRADS